METEEFPDYSQNFMEMMEDITKRLNAMEEKQCANSKQNKEIATPNVNDVMHRIIIENKELKRHVKELEKIIKENQNTKETTIKTPTFSETMSNNITTRVVHPFPPPHNKFINLFKRGNITIRTQRDGEKPFRNMSPEQIVLTVEEALGIIDEKVNDQKIEIKSMIRYESGDIRLLTKDRMQSRWLLENRHLWTHLADPLFITSQSLYLVLIHSVPIYFEAEDELFIQEFFSENNIPREAMKR
ncbi:hypothetical protein O181_000681 [Austropuccinia psidii MF-1]|uniref:Uncharacterized protein n=1 Tax=Austropuccinia psidii MF-1 TaxID=1389203 RepID=A0A9Q3B8Z3_9BASI|nr:hypothetical protein [Austropuccinia psidii MF-1]